MNRKFNKKINNKLNKIFEPDEYVEYTPKELLKEIGMAILVITVFTVSLYIG